MHSVGPFVSVPARLFSDRVAKRDGDKMEGRGRTQFAQKKRRVFLGAGPPGSTKRRRVNITKDRKATVAQKEVQEEVRRRERPSSAQTHRKRCTRPRAHRKQRTRPRAHNGERFCRSTLGALIFAMPLKPIIF